MDAWAEAQKADWRLTRRKNNRSRFSATTFVTYYVFDNCLLAVRMHCILSASFHRFMIRAEKK